MFVSQSSLLRTQNEALSEQPGNRGGQCFEREPVLVNAARLTASVGPEVELKIRPARPRDLRYDIARDEQARWVKALFRHYPRHRDEEGGRSGHEVRAVDQHLAGCVRLIQLGGLHLQAQGRAGGKASNEQLCGLQVGKRPEETAIIQSREATRHLELAQRADDPGLVRDELLWRNFLGMSRNCLSTNASGQLLDRNQV